MNCEHVHVLVRELLQKTLGVATQQARGVIARCTQVQDDVPGQFGCQNGPRRGKARCDCRNIEGDGRGAWVDFCGAAGGDDLTGKAGFEYQLCG